MKIKSIALIELNPKYLKIIEEKIGIKQSEIFNNAEFKYETIHFQK